MITVGYLYDTAQLRSPVQHIVDLVQHIAMSINGLLLQRMNRSALERRDRDGKEEKYKEGHIADFL